jgi:hypothetical protein
MMEELSPQEIAYIGSRGFGTTDLIDRDGLPATSPPSIYLHHFSRDGVFRYWWGDRPAPPSTPAVTEPAQEVAEFRARLGWESDRPLFGIDPGSLRLYRQLGKWVLDNAHVTNMSPKAATFVWRFESLRQAIDAAEDYFIDRLLQNDTNNTLPEYR